MNGRHPLSLVFAAAIEEAETGKGTRHGGESKPFYDQPWRHIADDCGTGFLTGQAVKKLSEAARRQGMGQLDPEDFVREMLGAINYAAMAVLVTLGNPDPTEGKSAVFSTVWGERAE